MAAIPERATQKFRATGDREYMKEFTEGRDAPTCQSCGFTIRRPQDQGTAADGSPSDQYCTVCYRDGAVLIGRGAVGLGALVLRAADGEAARFAGWSVATLGEFLHVLVIAGGSKLPGRARWSGGH